MCLVCVMSLFILVFAGYIKAIAPSRARSAFSNPARLAEKELKLTYPRADVVSRTRAEARSVEESTSANVFRMAGIYGGEPYHVPATWNRLHVPWFQPSFVRMLTPRESKYRYLYSPIRTAASDGIGHSMGVVNYEFNLALRFNLTYSHRVGTYSSLTDENKLAVEDFFGWGNDEILRTEIQSEGCLPEKGSWSSNDSKACRVCHRPFLNGRMGIKHVVNIPEAMEYNCHCAEERCVVITGNYVVQHSESHTIFQTPRTSCEAPPTDGNYLKTKNLFFHKYWNRHGRLPWRTDVAKSRLRPIRLVDSELNVAVHIRRGDFLDPKTKGGRVVTRDEVFANVVVNALAIVGEANGTLANMPVAVHIYSEGKLTSDRVTSIHAVKSQDKHYYDCNGVQRDSVWWTELITRTWQKVSNERFGGRPFGRRLRVLLHISDDTLLSLHEMVSADIFVGSVSGLSNSLVWSLSRGIVLIPPYGAIRSERGKKGDICCSIPFHNDNGSFPHGLFRKYWAVFAKANEEAARHASTL